MMRIEFDVVGKTLDELHDRAEAKLSELMPDVGPGRLLLYDMRVVPHHMTVGVPAPLWKGEVVWVERP